MKISGIKSKEKNRIKEKQLKREKNEKWVSRQKENIQKRNKNIKTKIKRRKN